MAIVYANIGSNLGDRKSHIHKALEAIGKNFGFYCISGYVESYPWGFDSHNRFLNLGVSFKSDLSPEDILDILQKIEREISTVSHRNSEGAYKDREVDIDIMAIDETRYKSPRLRIPHRHLLRRDFFRQPLKELAPEWKYPYRNFLPAGTFTFITLLAIFWLTLAPKPLGDEPPELFPGADKVVHAIMFGGLSWMMLLDWQLKHNWQRVKWMFALVAASVSSLIGILIEIAQDAMGMGRGFDYADIIADVTGAFSFSVLWMIFQKIWVERLRI